MKRLFTTLALAAAALSCAAQDAPTLERRVRPWPR
jgi:hypothetical protein